MFVCSHSASKFGPCLKELTGGKKVTPPCEIVSGADGKVVALFLSNNPFGESQGDYAYLKPLAAGGFSIVTWKDLSHEGSGMQLKKDLAEVK